MKNSLFSFNGIAPASVCSIDLNPFDEGGLFGSGDNEKSKKLQQRATGIWTGGASDPLHPNMVWDPDSQSMVPENTGMYGEIPSVEDTQLSYGTGADQINPFEVGPGYQAATLNPWESGTSAFDTRGPSAYDSMTGSAYGSLSLDPTARKGMTDTLDYFRDVQKNPMDAIAEADYARRAKQAELSRRGNSEAALSNLEARGMGGSGNALLSQLVNNQGAASDRYQAGLDTNATAQARRDAAARSAGDTAAQLGTEEGNLDTSRAAGTDAYAGTRAAGKDAFSNQNATGTDAFDEWNAGKTFDTNKYNADAQTQQYKDYTDRRSGVLDANTAEHNKAVQYNTVGAPQQHFANEMGVTQGATGQIGTQAGALQAGAVYPFQDVVLPTISAVGKAAKDSKL